MTKELNQPKAVNIIRPSSHHLLSQNVKRMPSANYSSSTNSSSSLSMRKPRVTSPATSTTTTNTTHSMTTTTTKAYNDKPLINLYHPPNRKQSSDEHQRPSRPLIELFKPQYPIHTPPPPQQQQQLRLTKSFTAPSLQDQIQSPQPTPSIRTHRAVVGPISVPVSAVSASTLEDKAEDVDSADTLSQVDSESDQSTYDDTDEEDESMVNEARVNRKIADLELSINSLLTVNAMLEATVRKQASQLGQLKKERISGDITSVIVEEIIPQEIEEDSDEDNWEDDILFQKIKKLTEHMIEEGQKSVDFEYKILGRVLTNYAPEEDEDDTISPLNTTMSIDNQPTESVFDDKSRRSKFITKRGKST